MLGARRRAQGVHMPAPPGRTRLAAVRGRTEAELRQRDFLAVRPGARLVGDGVDRVTDALVVHIAVVAIPGPPSKWRRQRKPVVCVRNCTAHVSTSLHSAGGDVQVVFPSGCNSTRAMHTDYHILTSRHGSEVPSNIILDLRALTPTCVRKAARTEGGCVWQRCSDEHGQSSACLAHHMHRGGLTAQALALAIAHLSYTAAYGIYHMHRGGVRIRIDLRATVGRAASMHTAIRRT